MMVSAPILAYADYKLPFKLYTDASFEGLGAVLSQVQGDKERVIAYASRTLSPNERNDKNYSSFKLELLALKWAITEKFKDYLWGAQLTVFTDNNPLVHLDTANLGAAEQRWVAQLANYDFVVKYRPGKENNNADALSRRPQEPKCHVMAVNTEDGATGGLQEWMGRQQEDPTLRYVITLLKQGKPLEHIKRSNRRLLAPYSKCWSQLRINDGLLMRLMEESGTSELSTRIVVPPGWRRLVWKEYHEAAGHMAGAKTMSLLRRRFYWPGQGEDVHRWSTECEYCRSQRPQPEIRAPLKSVVTSYPMEILAIDYLSLGRDGDVYPNILVATDVFSRFAWAMPTRDQTAITTAKMLWQYVIQPFGYPERVHSDRGAAFESSIMAELCKMYGARKSRTTPYHPQGNGSVERFNQTLLTMLSSLEGEEQTQWPQKLPELVHAYNNFVHESTGLSPFFVMFGRHARLPVDVMMGASTAMGGATSRGWVQTHHKTLLWAYETVAEQARKRQKKDQQRHNQKQRALPLLPGERVLLRNFGWRAQGKLAPRWVREPFVVIAALSPDGLVYRVRPEGRDGPEKTIHRNDLRHCSYPIAEPPPETGSLQDRSVVSRPPLVLPFRPQWMPIQGEATDGQQAERLQPPGPVVQELRAAQMQEAQIPAEQPGPHRNALPRRSTRTNLGVRPARFCE